MDEARECSNCYFDAFSDQGQKDVRKLFGKMDKDGNELVSMQEFTQYMMKAGIKDAEWCSNLFSRVDADGNGSIDAEEAKLLYYTVISRPFCGHCNCLVTGIYYTCAKCFKKSKPYDLLPKLL